MLDYESIKTGGQLMIMVFIGIGGAYKYFTDKKRHKEITSNQNKKLKYAKTRNELALEQTMKLDALQESIDMNNGFRTPDRVKELKHVAYGDQKNYFIKEMMLLYKRNSIEKENDRIEDIEVVVAKTVTITDTFLMKYIPESYLASTKCKIDFVNSHSIPQRVYKVFVDAKMTKSGCDMYGRLAGIYDYALGQVKEHFYDDNGRVKK